MPCLSYASVGRMIIPPVVRCRSAPSPRQMKGESSAEVLQRPSFYVSALAGALACSLTHTMVVPLDLIKTRIQTDENLKRLSTRQVFKYIRSTEGLKGLFQGSSAVMIGYFLQGAAKFGIYDKLKRVMQQSLMNRGKWDEHLKLPVYLGASAVAESVATLFLCPMETVKIAIMTKMHSFDLKTSMNTKLLFVMDRLVKEGGKCALWRGLPWVMLRQVPYACIKLAGYDVISEKLMVLLTDFKYKWSNAIAEKESRRGMQVALPALLTAGEEKEICKPISVQILSGIVAGVIAAVLSQPADVLLSKICGASVGADASSCIVLSGPLDVVSVVKELGWQGCFAGLQSRAAMVSTMTATQFMIYEGAKELLTIISAPQDVCG